MREIIHKKAYAKLNLYLDITGLAKNNYHTLETVMQSIDLCDDIYLSVCENDSDIIIISCDNPEIPTDGRNIVYKTAVEFLCRLHNKKHYSINIDIKKRIPVEGGLGGSSTNGAAVLTALNEWFGFPFTTDELCKMGAKLSADLPFCVMSGTCSCKGIGDVITRLKPVSDCYFLIVKPDFSFNSGVGYRLYDKNPVPRRGDFGAFTERIENGCFVGCIGLMYNVFENIYNDERIAEYKKKFIESGAEGALMTGSGSAVFGVYGNRDTAENALRTFTQTGIGTLILANPYVCT